MTNHESRIGRLLPLAVPALTATASFFSWVVLINRMQIPYYLYYQRTIYLIYFSRSLDPVIWILSSALAVIVLAVAQARSVWLWPTILLLWLGITAGTLGMIGLLGQAGFLAGPLLTLSGCVIGAIVSIKELSSTARANFLAILLVALSLLILPAELGSLFYYVLSAFEHGIQAGGSWEMLELQLWYTVFPLVPFLYVIFLFSWIWAPLIAKLIWRSRQVTNGTGAGGSVKNNRGWLLVVGGYILLAVFIGYYAYFRDPTYPLVGTDIYWRNALPAERVLASSSWIDAAAKERHPIVVFGIAALSSLSRLGVESVLRLAYVGLILAFGAGVFLLVLLASGDKMLASMSALMCTISAPTTDGIYTGIIANWVAMIVWILSLTMLARNRRKGLGGYAVPILGLSLGSLAVLFIHPWTWLAMMVGLIAFPIVAILFRLKGAFRDLVSVLVVILLNVGALALSLQVLLKSQGWRLFEAFSEVQRTLGSKYLGLGSWEIIVFFSQIWAQFLNPILLMLSVLGAIVLARKRDRLSAILFAWIVAACATSLLAAPMGYDPLEAGRGQTQLFRAMFLTPFQIPSAIAFLFVESIVGTRLPMTAHPRAAKIVLWAVMGVILLGMINGAFRALFPLLTDAHNYPNPLAP